MTTYTWQYGSAAAGLQFTIAYDNTTSEFTVTSLVGSFDLNALWVSDGNNTADPYPPLAKSDKDLNMNGSNTVWDDGTSSTQAIVWDDYGKLSSAGLGSAGENKVSFIDSGTTHTFALSDFVGLSSFDPTTFDTLGVRATSVNGNQTIKWVDETPEVGGGEEPSILQVTDTPAVFESTPDISGDGRFLTWMAQVSLGLDIFWTDLDNPNVVKTVGGASQVGDQLIPHISGDGEFVSFDSVDLLSEIFVWQPATDITTLVPQSSVSVSQISDDGNHVVFGNGGEIYDWNPNTPSVLPTLVSDSSHLAIRPAVSEDGSFVVYEDRTNIPSGDSQIILREVASGDIWVVNGTKPLDELPSISADGNYVTFWNRDSTALSSDVYLFHRLPDGAGELTNISLGLPTDGDERILRDAVSGDGRFVAFSSTSGGQTDVFVWDREEDTYANVTAEMDGTAAQASISEDGRYIAFRADPDGLQFDIYRAENPLHDDFIV